MGCPIRTLQDHGLVTGSPGLFAGSCVLHRLSTPSHPPCTLVPGHTNRTPCFLLRFHTRTASSPRRCIRTSSRLPPHPRLRLDEPEVRPASIDRFINLWHYKIIFPTRIQPASFDLGRSGQHFFTTCSPSTPNHTCVRFRLRRHSLSLLTRAPGHESSALRRKTASGKSSVEGRSFVSGCQGRHPKAGFLVENRSSDWHGRFSLAAASLAGGESRPSSLSVKRQGAFVLTSPSTTRT